MKLITALLCLVPSVLAASRTSPPSGCVHVAKSGGSFTSLQAAVNSLSTTATGTQCIFVNQGTYTEQVLIPSRSARLTIYGYTTDTTSYSQNRAILTFNNNAASAGNNDASATLRVRSANVKVYNLNVVNTCKSSLPRLEGVSAPFAALNTSCMGHLSCESQLTLHQLAKDPKLLP